MEEVAIKIEHISKEYRLGAIGGGTLRGDLQSWWARIRGREDPNSIIGSDPNVKIGERFKALDDVSFDVKKGEAIGIIGHNGAGKSTLLKLLSRVTAPTNGTISYNGRIASMLEVGTGFHPELTGRENVYMNGAILGMTKDEISKKFDQIVEFAEMEKFIDTPVKRYSSGMYVKLAFSVAAHLDSEIMVMDEVLAVGDMKFQKKCLSRMSDAANKEGRTVLYVSHNMHTIRQLCERCIVLEKGKVIFNGEVESGISLYLGNNSGNQIFYTYEKYDRERIADQKMIIQSLQILGLKEPIIHNSKIEIKINVYSKEQYHNVAFRCIIFSSDNEPIGMSCTLPCLEIYCGMNEVNLQLDLPGLERGNYKARIVFYEVDEYGNEVVHDVIHDAFSFVIDNKSIENSTLKLWKTNAWGYINFPDINVL